MPPAGKTKQTKLTALFFLLFLSSSAEAGDLLCRILPCGKLGCSSLLSPCRWFKCCRGNEEKPTGPVTCENARNFEDKVCDPDIVYDVLIVGAGWAGVGAAREIEIYNKNYRIPNLQEPITYCMIDAASFFGGRAVAAHWIHGGEDNIMFQMMWDLGNYFDYEITNWHDIQFYECEPDLATCPSVKAFDPQAIEDELAQAYDCVFDKCYDFWFGDTSPYTPSTTIRELLTDCNWTIDNPDNGGIRNMLEWYDYDFEFGDLPEEKGMDAFPLGPEDFTNSRNFSDLFINDDGNSQIIAVALADDVGVCANVELCTEAYMIDWTSVPLEISTRCSCCTGEETRTLQANKVIVTVSVGVLDQRGDDSHGARMFEPKLPLTKMNGMKNYFYMIEFMELTFQFSDEVWDGGPWEAHQWTAVETAERGRCNFWMTLETSSDDEFVPGSHAMVCTLLTDTIRKLAPPGLTVLEARDFIASPDTGPPIVNELLKNTLGKIQDMPFECGWENPYMWSPKEPGTTPTNGKCGYKTYRSNEWWQGSYESTKPGATDQDFDNYVEPLGPLFSSETTLYFSGTATCDRHWGYFHAAFWSGARDANYIIDNIEGVTGANPDATENYCDSGPFGGTSARRSH